MGKTSWAGDVMTRGLKAREVQPALAFCHSAKLCVCVSHDLWSVSLIYCCLSCYKSSNIESSHMSKLRQRQRNTRAKADHITDCVFPPSHTTLNERGYTQFVRGLIGSEECRVCSRGGRLPTLWVASTAYASLPENSLWGGSFYQHSSWGRPCFCRGGVVAVLVRIADRSDGRNEDERASIFFLFHQIQHPLSGIGSPPLGSSPWSKGSTLRLSSSEEGDGEDVNELSQSLMFAQAYCERIKKKKKESMSGERRSHTQLSWEKKEGLIVFLRCNTLCSLRACSEVCVPVISQSVPATTEALRRLRSRGSHKDLADGLVTGSPYLHLHSPDLALSRSGSLCCSSSPLSESALICSNFTLRRFILFLYPSGSRFICRGNTCIPIILSSLYESFTSDRVYLSGCLTAFNFE